MIDETQPLHPGRNYPQRILAVDDDPVVIEFLRLYLTLDGVHLDTAADGAAAIARSIETYDLLLLDLEMPEVTGFEVLQTLKNLNLRNPPPVVVLTSRTDAAAIGKAFELGASAYVLKPIAKDSLIAKIRDVYTAATR